MEESFVEFTEENIMQTTQNGRQEELNENQRDLVGNFKKTRYFRQINENHRKNVVHRRNEFSWKMMIESTNR